MGTFLFGVGVLQLLENDGWWGPDKSQFDGGWGLKFLLMFFFKCLPPLIISGIALT